MADTSRISIGETEAPCARVPQVVIVGGGFGGLAAAKALRKAPVQVILIAGQTIGFDFRAVPSF
jgi:NADPH-dependent 2,4-dienoyl-CoA reductase/sulfur reductase-like enzyme